MALLWDLHLGATWAMVGLIWFVQVVEYPLLASVRGERFRTAHQFHLARTGRVVIPLMLAEAVTLGLLLTRPGTYAALLFSSAALLVAVWICTFAVQVPLHRRLSLGPDVAVARRLVRSNWIRTALWTARGLLLVGGAALVT